MNDLKRNKHFPEKIASNLKFLNNLQPEWSRHVTIVHQTKDLHTDDYTQLYDFLKYNQKENYLQQLMPNPEDITDSTTAINMALVLMAKAFKLNYSTPTNNNQRISSNLRNGQIAQPGMNMGQDRQMQMIGGIQLQAEEYDLMAAAADLDEIEEVNANCILMANLQQASTSGTQTDSAPVYDTDGSAEVHENYDDNEIFNMFTQEEHYTELLEPILESHQVSQNDNDVIFEDTNVEQGGEIVEQHPANFEETHALYESLYQNLEIEVEKVNSQASTSGTQTDKAPVYDSDGSAENDNNVTSEVTSMEHSGEAVEQHPVNIEETRALYDSLYQNLAIEVEKVNSVNRKLKETNADLTTELARFKNQEKCDECKYDKILYEKVYKDMQQKIERLQAQLGDFKGKVRILHVYQIPLILCLRNLRMRTWN
nr:hypothetical protein [Tanacetum cinerariifolium]